ncbi:Elongation of very long chain fatty acids protein AAEL008004 [Gryllus bimaculatus]|nr:Elongation of very long chain fatty acids protein AAEL008004 [Gryllus bimaculatus]
MANVVNSTQSFIYDLYNFYQWTQAMADQRTKGWMLVDSPFPTLVYTMIYFLIVWAGPKLMKNRKPFQLTWALVPYNLAMAALNLYIAVELLCASTKLRYNYLCQPVSKLRHPDEIRIQFTTAMIMGINGIRSGCDFPLWMQYTLVIYMISFIVLFGNFYIKAYIEKGSKVFEGNSRSQMHVANGYMNGIEHAMLQNGDCKKLH